MVVRSEPLVEEFLPPRSLRLRRIQVQLGHVASLHALRDVDLGRPQNRWRQIYVQGKFGSLGAGRRCGHPRILDDQWHHERFLEAVPLFCQAVLSMKIPVICREYDHGLVQNALPFQLVNDPAARRIHLRCHPVRILHHVLVLFLGIVPLQRPPASVVGRFLQERWQRLEMLIRKRLWMGHFGVGVHPHAAVHRPVLLRTSILGMRRKEADRQHERLANRP
mmetsp:Transcript_15851/g.44437  ORF Transcript_15851/g.44437 Transcript_15851/m.44437 type:complete len:221 (+) Transcript_15851:380-1042(+)